MVMTIRSFQRYEELWGWKSRCPDITEGMRAYARSQSNFWSRLADQMLVSCREQLYVSLLMLYRLCAYIGNSRMKLSN